MNQFKYLSSFTKFLNEDADNKYYHEVSIDEFRSKENIDIEIFSNEIHLLVNVSDISDYNCYNKRDLTMEMISFNTPTMGVDIFLSNDEWFKVSILKFSTPEVKSHQLFYFCDQFEGLKKLLVDKNIIK